MNYFIEELLAHQRHQEHLREARRPRYAVLAASAPRSTAPSPARTMTTLTLLVFWFVGLNALAGAASLLLFAQHTNSLFFWPITPPLNAALFGALYLSGGAAVCWLAWRGRWEPARVLIPVLVSAGLLISGVTLAHLERFSPGVRLAYWLGVYAGAPLLALLVYALQERRGARWAVVTPLVPATRRLAAASGALLLGAGALIMVWPAPFVASWPWPVTPLMLRIFAAWFGAFGVGLLWFLVDNDWERLALLPRLLIGAAGLDLAVLVVHRGDLTTTGPRLWLYVAHLLALAGLGCLMYALQHSGWPAAARSALTLVGRRPL